MTEHECTSHGLPPSSLAEWRLRKEAAKVVQLQPLVFFPHLVSLSGAGNAADLYDYMGDPNRAPKIFKKDPRFMFLARDPSHRGKIRPSGVREAISILFAEKIGLVRWPVARYPDPAYDFVDGTGAVIDVKTPVSPNKDERWDFSLEEVFHSIQHELNNPVPKGSTPTKVLLDVSYLEHDHYKMLRNKLDKSLPEDTRSRLIQVSVPFAKLAPRTIRRYRAHCQHLPQNIIYPPPYHVPLPPNNP